MIDKKNEFIAFDRCGWMDNYGRFTHLPTGNTLVQQGWHNQLAWDREQLIWFRMFPGLSVYDNCRSGPYRPEGRILGTTDEICERLEKRLSES